MGLATTGVGGWEGERHPTVVGAEEPSEDRQVLPKT